MTHHDWVPERAIGVYTRRSATGLLIETYHDGYELNESGAFIWSMVGGGASSAHMAKCVAERYELGPEEASDAVHTFLAVLRERGFLAGQSSGAPDWEKV